MTLLINAFNYLFKSKSAVINKAFSSVNQQENSGLRNLGEQHLRMFIENAPDAFFIHDLQGRFVDVNKAAYLGLGYTRDELLALRVFDVEMEANRNLLLNRIWPALNHGSSTLIQGKHKRKNGSIFPVDVNITCMKDNGTDLIFALAHNIAESESIKETFQKLALTDELTQLPNRRSFITTLDKEISKAKRKCTELSLLMVDIDFFKNINDNYGHSIGDIALKQFAKVSKDILRNEEILGRIGGEEFAVLLTETNTNDALIVANKLRYEIDNTFFNIEGLELWYTISIGLASLHNTDMCSNRLLKNADKALYKAKVQGRNRVEIFC